MPCSDAIAVTLFTGIVAVLFAASYRHHHRHGLHVEAIFGVLHLGRTQAIRYRVAIYVISYVAALATEARSGLSIFRAKNDAHQAVPFTILP